MLDVPGLFPNLPLNIGSRFSTQAWGPSLASSVLADANLVRSYVENLREVLASSPLPEQKAFIRSFVKDVRVTGREVLVSYTMPLPSDRVAHDHDMVGVLDIVHYGGAKWTIDRTFELAFALTI